MSTVDWVVRYQVYCIHHPKIYCMKKMFAFDGFFGGGKSYDLSPQSSTSPVTTTAFSQPHVLHTRMKEEKMSHGATVLAKLSPVRLEMNHGGVVMYFCPMEKLEILEVMSEGDGKSIPIEAKVEGLNVPSHFKPGLYELENVELTSNGAIQVKATAKTAWKAVEKTKLA